MNATLRSLRVSSPAKGDSDETLKEKISQANLTPANQAAKLMLLSLLARYDLGTENGS